MKHQTRYWVTCPDCGHQMEGTNEGGPIRGQHCDKCEANFSFTNEELAITESVETGSR